MFHTNHLLFILYAVWIINMALFSNTYYYLNNLNNLNFLTYSHYSTIYIKTKNKICFCVGEIKYGVVKRLRMLRMLRKLKSWENVRMLGCAYVRMLYSVTAPRCWYLLVCSKMVRTTEYWKNLKLGQNYLLFISLYIYFFLEILIGRKEPEVFWVCVGFTRSWYTYNYTAL